MPKRWRIASYDSARVAALGQAAGIPAVVAQLLIGRGICDADGVRQFLDVKLSGLRDPELLPGAVARGRASAPGDSRWPADHRLRRLRRRRHDGHVDSAAAACGCSVPKADFYVPNRIDEGYGLNHEALRTIAGQGGDVVVTVDCGITSVAEAETARELGLTLIITDHHQPRASKTESRRDAAVRQPGRLPNAAAIVHPGLPGSTYPFPGLVRRGGGAEGRVGAVSAGERGEARRRGDADVFDAGRGAGGGRARWPTSCRSWMRTAFWCGMGSIACGIIRRPGSRRSSR